MEQDKNMAPLDEKQEEPAKTPLKTRRCRGGGVFCCAIPIEQEDALNSHDVTTRNRRFANPHSPPFPPNNKKEEWPKNRVSPLKKKEEKRRAQDNDDA